MKAKNIIYQLQKLDPDTEIVLREVLPGGTPTYTYLIVSHSGDRLYEIENHQPVYVIPLEPRVFSEQDITTGFMSDKIEVVK